MCCSSAIQIQLGIWHLCLSPLGILPFLPLLFQTFCSACICPLCIYGDPAIAVLSCAEFFSVVLVIFTSTNIIRTLFWVWSIVWSWAGRGRLHQYDSHLVGTGRWNWGKAKQGIGCYGLRWLQVPCVELHSHFFCLSLDWPPGTMSLGRVSSPGGGT